MTFPSKYNHFSLRAPVQNIFAVSAGDLLAVALPDFIGDLVSMTRIFPIIGTGFVVEQVCRHKSIDTAVAAYLEQGTGGREWRLAGRNHKMI